MWWLSPFWSASWKRIIIDEPSCTKTSRTNKPSGIGRPTVSVPDFFVPSIDYARDTSRLREMAMYRKSRLSLNGWALYKTMVAQLKAAPSVKSFQSFTFTSMQAEGLWFLTVLVNQRTTLWPTLPLPWIAGKLRPARLAVSIAGPSKPACWQSSANWGRRLCLAIKLPAWSALHLERSAQRG